MRIGFIGLGDFGGNLAGLLRPNDWQFCVYDLNVEVMASVVAAGATVAAKGGAAVDCPMPGGCHRTATGNISILAGAERPVLSLFCRS